MTILLHLTKTQRVQIQNLETNPGILPFKMGSARVKIGSHVFLHYIDLIPLKVQVDSITNQYFKLNFTINNSTPTHRIPLYESYKHLSYEVNVVNHKIDSLMASKRSKRGLINPLGSLIKAISGNLDQEDANEIHGNILQLENNQDKIITKVNKQWSLTTNLMKNINNTLTVVSNNQKAIENKINEMVYDLKRIEFNYVHYLEIHEIMDQIKLNLDSLLDFLNDVENAISFATLKTLHRNIVSPNDLQEIVKTLHKSHNELQLIFSEENFIRYYSIVETTVFAIGNRIVFSLDFPLVHSDVFESFHLFSVPNKNNSIIIPPSTFLILNKEYYQYQNEECLDLQPNYFCKKNHLLPTRENSDCITSLLSTSSNLDKCQQVPVHLSRNIIEEIDSAHYIGILPETQKIQTSCEEDEVATLKGTYLFVIPPKCSLETSKLIYKNEKGIFHGHPVTLEEIKTFDVPLMQVEKIRLEKIPLDRLHELQLQASQEEPLEFSRLRNPQTDWLFWILFSIVLTIIAYIVAKNGTKIIQIIRKSKIEDPVTESQVVPPLRSF